MNHKSKSLFLMSLCQGLAVFAAGVIPAWLIGILLSLAVFYIPGLHRDGIHIYTSLGSVFSLLAPLFSLFASAFSRIAEFSMMLSFQRTRREYFLSCLLSDFCTALIGVCIIRLLSEAELLLAAALPSAERLISFDHFLTAPVLLFWAFFLTCLCTVVTWLFVRVGNSVGVLLLCAVTFLVSGAAMLCRRFPPLEHMLQDFLLGLLRIPYSFILLPALFCVLFLIIGWILSRRAAVR